MTGAGEPPDTVQALARRRAEARAGRDWASADTLRAEIADAGWLVHDVADGFTLTPKPAYDVLADLAAVVAAPQVLGERRATVSVVVDGWPEDAHTCLQALCAHLPEDVGVSVLVAGAAEAGAVVHEVAAAHPGRVEELHLAGAARFGPARAALLRRDTAGIHVWLEPSTVLGGDALTPLLAAFDDPAVVGAGWRGADIDADWSSFHDAGPGEVDAVMGYLFAMRRDAALAVAADPASLFTGARYYRNVDLELSFALRESGGRLVALPDLPVGQGRHHGYHDVDPAFRERESKRNYDRFLRRFRGRDDLRTAKRSAP